MNTYRIIKTDVKEFPYNVQILTKTTDGKWWYCGNGKFCRNKDEIKEIINKYNAIKYEDVVEEERKNNTMKKNNTTVYTKEMAKINNLSLIKRFYEDDELLIPYVVVRNYDGTKEYGNQWSHAIDYFVDLGEAIEVMANTLRHEESERRHFKWTEDFICKNKGKIVSEMELKIYFQIDRMFYEENNGKDYPAGDDFYLFLDFLKDNFLEECEHVEITMEKVQLISCQYWLTKEEIEDLYHLKNPHHDDMEKRLELEGNVEYLIKASLVDNNGNEIEELFDWEEE